MKVFLWMFFEQPYPQLVISDVMPGDPFEAKGRLYMDSGHGDFTGFYDWLRASSGALVGIRYLPFDDNDELWATLEPIRKLSYVQDCGRRVLELFFSDQRTYEPERSVNQEFGDNKVFTASDGRILITFYAGQLAGEALESIRQYCVPVGT